MREQPVAHRLLRVRVYREGGANLAVWDLLLVFCFVAPIAGANSEAKTFHVALSLHVACVLVGVIFGAASAFLVRIIGEKVAAPFGKGEAVHSTWPLRGLYTGALIWSVLSLFIGGWCARGFMHIVR